ncbi:MAG: ribose-phosphate diphosphokinase [Candidatus Aenigmatarchaeota archaeon]
MSRDLRDMIFLCTNENEDFVKLVHKLFSEKYGEVSFGRINITYHNDKSIDVQIKDNIRKRDVYIFHHFYDYKNEYDPNIGFMKLYFIDDAIRNSSVNEITYILPYIPFQRQDRMDRPGVALNARRTMQMLRGYDSIIPMRVVTFDMHAGQIQGFVGYPIDNLTAYSLFLDYFRNIDGNFTIVSPDAGGVKRAKMFSKDLPGSRLVVISKTRSEAGSIEDIYIMGKEHVENRDVIILDDLIDTGGTILEEAKKLKEAKARNIYTCATHPVFSPKKDKKTDVILYYPEEEFPKNGIKVITTDTIPKNKEYIEKNKDWLNVLTVAPIISDAIYEIQTGGSISKLFHL